MLFFFFFKQKTAYEMRISDWSSDVCSSDLLEARWADSAATTLVTDAAGIVVMSSDPRWRFRSLRPIAAETQRRLRATRSYGEARLQPLPIRRTGGDRKSVGEGKGVAVRVDRGWRRIIQNKTQKTTIN